MSYKFSVCYDEQNYLAANRLHFWSTAKSFKFLRALAWLVGVYFILGLSVMLINAVPLSAKEILRITAIALAAGAAVLLFGYTLWYFMLPRRTRKLLAQQKLLHEVMQFDVNDEMVEIVSQLLTTKLPYDRVHKWAENSDVFLIYLSDQSFLYVPSEAAHTGAVNMIRANLIAAGISGKVL